jgi:hypothetical protein
MTKPEARMERGGTKHGPVRDDQLAKESEGMVRGRGSTHAEEWKDPEPTDREADRAIGQQPPGREPAAPPGMSPRDVAIRSNLAAVLAGTEFPATRASLLRYLDQVVAAGPIMNAIAALPGDREFANSGEVTDCLGIPREAHRF